MSLLGLKLLDIFRELLPGLLETFRSEDSPASGRIPLVGGIPGIELPSAPSINRYWSSGALRFLGLLFRCCSFLLELFDSLSLSIEEPLVLIGCPAEPVLEVSVVAILFELLQLKFGRLGPIAWIIFNRRQELVVGACGSPWLCRIDRSLAALCHLPGFLLDFLLKLIVEFGIALHVLLHLLLEFFPGLLAEFIIER